MNKNLSFLFTLSFYLTNSFAQEITKNTEGSLNFSVIDIAHKNVTTNLFKITNKIDSYFGSEVPLEQKNGSSIQLKYMTTSKEFSKATTKPDIKINVKFKQLQKKLNFKFESIYDDQDQSIANSEKTDSINQVENQESPLFRASLGFFKEQKGLWNFSMDTGVKIQAPPNPFARIQGQRSFNFDQIEFRLKDKVMIDEANGIYNYTDANFYIKSSGRFTFSYTNQYIWKNDDNELITVHGPSIFQEVDDKQLLSYHLKTRFNNKPTYAITGHELFCVYRRNLYKNWLFLELIPGLSFFAEDDYAKIGYITSKLEVNIGDF